MSAVLTRRRPGSARDRDRDRDRDAARQPLRQESLFGAGMVDAAIVPVAALTSAAPAAASAPTEARPERGRAEREPAPARLAGPTLDEAITALWGKLVSGDAVECPACGAAAMEPRHSAGAGVVGGRCGACETTLA